MPVWPFSRGATPLDQKLWDPRGPVVSQQSRDAIAKLHEGFNAEEWETVVVLALALGNRTRELTHKKPVRDVAAAFWLLGLYAADQATARQTP